MAGGSQGLVDGIGREAKFYHPTGISLDVYSGILYVADHVRALSTFSFYFCLTLFLAITLVKTRGRGQTTMGGKRGIFTTSISHFRSLAFA